MPSGCVIDADSYTLSPSVGGINIAKDGTISVSMSSAIASTNQTVSVTSNGGAETHSSTPFSVQVEDCLSKAVFPLISD